MKNLFAFAVFLLTFFFLPGSVFAAAPSLKITSPMPDEIIDGYIVTVKFEVSGFSLTDYRTVTRPVFGQGHVDFWLDAESTDLAKAIKWSKTDDYVFADVAPREHTLVVSLVGNDNQPLNPTVTQTVKFKTSVSGAASASGSSGNKMTGTPAPGASANLSAFQRYSGSRTAKPLAIGLITLVLGLISFVILKR